MDTGEPASGKGCWAQARHAFFLEEATRRYGSHRRAGATGRPVMLLVFAEMMGCRIRRLSSRSSSVLPGLSAFINGKRGMVWSGHASTIAAAADTQWSSCLICLQRRLIGGRKGGWADTVSGLLAVLAAAAASAVVVSTDRRTAGDGVRPAIGTIPKRLMPIWMRMEIGPDN